MLLLKCGIDADDDMPALILDLLLSVRAVDRSTREFGAGECWLAAIGSKIAPSRVYGSSWPSLGQMDCWQSVRTGHLQRASSDRQHPLGPKPVALFCSFAYRRSCTFVLYRIQKHISLVPQLLVLYTLGLPRPCYWKRVLKTEINATASCISDRCRQRSESAFVNCKQYKMAI